MWILRHLLFKMFYQEEQQTHFHSIQETLIHRVLHEFMHWLIQAMGLSSQVCTTSINMRLCLVIQVTPTFYFRISCCSWHKWQNSNKPNHHTSNQRRQTSRKEKCSQCHWEKIQNQHQWENYWIKKYNCWKRGQGLISLQECQLVSKY